MMKLTYWIIVAVIVVIIGILIFISSQSVPSGETDSASATIDSSSQLTSIISGDITMPDAVATLYYGNGCPHCSNLEKWLQDNKYLPSGKTVDQNSVDIWMSSAKVKFNIKEVWKNSANSAELSANATSLGLPSEQVGVPFLYDSVNKKSYIGEVDIKNFFQSK